MSKLGSAGIFLTAGDMAIQQRLPSVDNSSFGDSCKARRASISKIHSQQISLIPTFPGSGQHISHAWEHNNATESF
jgi:hypothetical protein